MKGGLKIPQPEAKRLLHERASMKREIKKAAVLGAGVMGSGIAAHLANAGLSVLLLDILPPDISDEEKNNPQARNRLAQKGKDSALQAKPPAFYVPENAELIQIGNFEDDLKKIKECDWVIEAVVENLEIKRNLFARVDECMGENTIVTSNTSGLSVEKMSEMRSENFKRNFFITHFFNPVRYMKLLEIIPGKNTDDEVVKTIADFATRKLGKGIVYAKDTPNFIANRIGVYSMMKTIYLMLEMGYEIDEVDAIAGLPLGRPGTAAFGTADLVGLDTFIHVAKTVYDGCPHDEERNVFKEPEFLRKMVEAGLLGRKAKGGFYRREKDGKEGERRLVIDWKTLNYREVKKYEYDSLLMAKNIHDVKERIKKVISSEDRAGKFAWKIIAHTLIYSANRVKEIADDILNIDNAMKWGFNWALGPFETWDAIGVKWSVEKMEKENMKVPAWVKDMLKKGIESFYTEKEKVHYYYDISRKRYKKISVPKEIIVLQDIKKDKERIVDSNMSASLIDIGDDVLCLEFHSPFVPKMNPIDDDMVAMMERAIEEAEKNYRGLVIHNQGENFSAGANVMLILMSARNKDWKKIEEIVSRFQNANLRIKRSRVPVVSAPHGFTLGGGAEVAMSAPRICAAAETYIGLVEIGVGLIPGGGGTLLMLLRHLEGIDEPILSNIPFIRKAFETIAMARVASSGDEAKKMKFLRASDKVVPNRDLQLHQAKQMVLSMSAEGYEPSKPAKLYLPGLDGVATFKSMLRNLRQTHQITEYEEKIGGKLAYVLCGGDTHISHPLAEEYILELEREAFVSLCGEEKTQERMEYFLKTGKTLRN